MKALKVENHKGEPLYIRQRCPQRCIIAVDFNASHVYYDIKGQCVPHYVFAFRFCPFCGRENKVFDEIAITVTED